MNIFVSNRLGHIGSVFEIPVIYCNELKKQAYAYLKWISQFFWDVKKLGSVITGLSNLNKAVLYNNRYQNLVTYFFLTKRNSPPSWPALRISEYSGV